MSFTTTSKLIIFGARSIALGACLAIKKLYPKCEVTNFMVSSLKENPTHLCGLPVIETGDCEDKNIPVLIAIPEDVQSVVTDILTDKDFQNIQIHIMQTHIERIPLQKYIWRNFTEISL